MNTVCVHGFLGTDGMWNALDIPNLVPVGLPGHSTFEDATRRLPVDATFNDALDNWRRRLPEGRFRLVGYSMGARLALCSAPALSDRITELVLIGVHPGIRDRAARERRRQWEESLAEELAQDDLSAVVDRWEQMPLFASQRALPPAVLHRQRQARCSHDSVQLARAVAAMGLSAMPDGWTVLPQLQFPVTFVTGAMDNAYVAFAQEACDMVQGARLFAIEGAGHNPVLEQPQAVREILLSCG